MTICGRRHFRAAARVLRTHCLACFAMFSISSGPGRLRVREAFSQAWNESFISWFMAFGAFSLPRAVQSCVGPADPETIMTTLNSHKRIDF
jgi:hypothetical protein